MDHSPDRHGDLAHVRARRGQLPLLRMCGSAARLTRYAPSPTGLHRQVG